MNQFRIDNFGWPEYEFLDVAELVADGRLDIFRSEFEYIETRSENWDDEDKGRMSGTITYYLNKDTNTYWAYQWLDNGTGEPELMYPNDHLIEVMPIKSVTIDYVSK